MAILTGVKILEEVKNGTIEIDKYDQSRINPNSYNVCLDNKLLIYKTPDTHHDMKRFRLMPKVHDVMSYYDDIILDMKKDNPTDEIIIPETGFMLQPGILYLGSTRERIMTKKYVPILSGRSSVGRLGMAVHITAGFGDVGFDGRWTLEIEVVHNLVIYPGLEIGQVYFETLEGDSSYQYHGRYNHQEGVTASRMYQEKRGMLER